MTTTTTTAAAPATIGASHRPAVIERGPRWLIPVAVLVLAGVVVGLIFVRSLAAPTVVAPTTGVEAARDAQQELAAIHAAGSGVIPPSTGDNARQGAAERRMLRAAQTAPGSGVEAARDARADVALQHSAR